MKCPHCNVEINPSFTSKDIISEGNSINWRVTSMLCPNSSCRKAIIYLEKLKRVQMQPGCFSYKKEESICINPIFSTNYFAPPEVDPIYTKDYNEAALILNFSPNASAALLRRCLQLILRDKVKVKADKLTNEIQEVLDKNLLPSYIADDLDAVRNVGNYAAHPTKNLSNGEIIESTKEEAEWLLNILFSLFDFYFVLPAKAQRRRDALNEKLKDAGKPKMKKS